MCLVFPSWLNATYKDSCFSPRAHLQLLLPQMRDFVLSVPLIIARPLIKRIILDRNSLSKRLMFDFPILFSITPTFLTCRSAPILLGSDLVHHEPRPSLQACIRFACPNTIGAGKAQ